MLRAIEAVSLMFYASTAIVPACFFFLSIYVHLMRVNILQYFQKEFLAFYIGKNGSFNYTNEIGLCTQRDKRKFFNIEIFSRRTYGL